MKTKVGDIVRVCLNRGHGHPKARLSAACRVVNVFPGDFPMIAVKFNGARRIALRWIRVAATAIALLAVIPSLPARSPGPLEAIRMVEGVTDPARPGPAGELGWHRITPSVWAQYTTAPFAWAGTDACLELWVSQRHLDWLERNLIARHGPHVSAYWLALAWNAGLSATLHDRASARARDYAQRVQNLCNLDDLVYRP